MRDALAGTSHTSASPPIACFLQWHMISEWASAWERIDRVHFRLRFNDTYTTTDWSTYGVVGSSAIEHLFQVIWLEK